VKKNYEEGYRWIKIFTKLANQFPVSYERVELIKKKISRDQLKVIDDTFDIWSKEYVSR